MISATLIGGELDGRGYQLAAPYVPTLLWLAPVQGQWLVIGTDRKPPGMAYPGALVYAIDSDDEVSMRRGAIQGRASYSHVEAQR